MRHFDSFKNKICTGCGGLFVWINSGRCDDCQHLKNRMAKNPELAEKLLKEIKTEPKKIKKEERTKGVYYSEGKKKPWIARYNIEPNMETPLGSFKTEGEAIEARKAAEKQYDGGL